MMAVKECDNELIEFLLVESMDLESIFYIVAIIVLIVNVVVVGILGWLGLYIWKKYRQLKAKTWRNLFLSLLALKPRMPLIPLLINAFMWWRKRGTNV